MKLLDYLKLTDVELQALIDDRTIDVADHPVFPLQMLTYGRKAVSDNTWPDAVRKCRGLIINAETDEIIARPYEKFFNLGDPNAVMPGVPFTEPDVVWEKMDGFLCTLYRWEGKEYIASKGSFTSPHAKWATAQYHKQRLPEGYWPTGCTPVFEGLSKSLRIVVDYGDREELVLTGLVNTETGVEYSPAILKDWGEQNGFSTPRSFDKSLATASAESLGDVKNFEGYVATWYRTDAPPFRVKIKFADYLRIHRMVTGVSPKRIYEALVNGWDSELDTWLNEANPWFNKFVAQWKRALEAQYSAYDEVVYMTHYSIAQQALAAAREGRLWTRKEWAEKVNGTTIPELRGAIFAKLDGKDVKPFIWKQVKSMLVNSKPMFDAHKL